MSPIKFGWPLKGRNMMMPRLIPNRPTGLVGQGDSSRTPRRRTAVIMAISVSLVTIGAVMCSLLSAPATSSISDLESCAAAVIMALLIGLLLIHRNTTEWRVRATQGQPCLVKETERQLRDMEQVTRAGSWRRNLLTDELQWSDHMHRIVGFSTGEPAPSFETFLARVHPEDRSIIDRMKDQAVHSGTSEGEYRIISPDGTIRFLHERATIDHDAEGRPCRLVGVTQDITERQTLERQLRQTEKLAALGTLMAGVAHELNNPLFAVTGYIELMTEKVQRGRYRGTGLTDDLAALGQATDRAMAIVQRFLRVARTAAPHREPIAVNALLEQALKLATHDLRINRIAVKTEFAKDLPPAIGDADGLLQVCLNLFTNARQAMVATHGGGTLQVTTRLAQTPAGPRVEFCVRDSGGGIAPEHLPRIFEPFFTTKPVGEGTGLGLSLCHRIVTELGGKLSCENRPGQGATFVVELLPAGETVPAMPVAHGLSLNGEAGRSHPYRPIEEHGHDRDELSHEGEGAVPVPPHEESYSVAGYRSSQDSHHDG